MVSLFWSAWKKTLTSHFLSPLSQFFSISLFPNCLFFRIFFSTLSLFSFLSVFFFPFFPSFFHSCHGIHGRGWLWNMCTDFQATECWCKNVPRDFSHLFSLLFHHFFLSSCQISLLSWFVHGFPFWSVFSFFFSFTTDCFSSSPKYEWIASRSDWTPSLSELNSVNARSRPSASLILYSTSFSFFAFSISFSFDSRSNVTAALSSAAVISARFF